MFENSGFIYLHISHIQELLKIKSLIHLEQYMDILKATNAYRRNFESNAQIQETSSTKYRNIKRLFSMTHKNLKEKDMISLRHLSVYLNHQKLELHLLEHNYPKISKVK